MYSEMDALWQNDEHDNHTLQVHVHLQICLDALQWADEHNKLFYIKSTCTCTFNV